MSEPISVQTGRLPEVGQKVLIYIPETSLYHNKGWQVSELFEYSGSKSGLFFGVHEKPENRQPTHWMPLPDPPREQS